MEWIFVKYVSLCLGSHLAKEVPSFHSNHKGRFEYSQFLKVQILDLSYFLLDLGKQKIYSFSNAFNLSFEKESLFKAIDFL